jgi:hypothetical protein
VTPSVLQGRFLGRLEENAQPIELLCMEGDYDELVRKAKWLVESTGQPIRVEDPETRAPVLTIEIRPTAARHYCIRDWDGEGWIHRYEPREAMA